MGPRTPARRGRTRPRAVLAAGPTDFGWTAYTPLSDESDGAMGWSDGSVAIVSRWELAGYAVVAVGVVVIAAGTGFQLGRRRADLQERPEPPA